MALTRSDSSVLASVFTVYHYDRRGRGRSTDTQPYAVEREVDDLAALIAEAGESAYVYAFSSGGLLALHAATAGLPIPRMAPRTRGRPPRMTRTAGFNLPLLWDPPRLNLPLLWDRRGSIFPCWGTRRGPWYNHDRES